MFGYTIIKKKNLRKLVTEILETILDRAKAELKALSLEEKLSFYNSKEKRIQELERYFKQYSHNGLVKEMMETPEWKEYQTYFQRTVNNKGQDFDIDKNQNKATDSQKESKFGFYSITTEPDENGHFTIPELDIIPKENWGKKVSSRDITWRKESCETKNNLEKDNKNQQSLLNSVKEILNWYKSEELQFTPESKDDIKDMFLNLEIAYNNVIGTFKEEQKSDSNLEKEVIKTL